MKILQSQLPIDEKNPNLAGSDRSSPYLFRIMGDRVEYRNHLSGALAKIFSDNIFNLWGVSLGRAELSSSDYDGRIAELISDSCGCRRGKEITLEVLVSR